MAFQIVSPFVMNIDGENFKDALKNFVKLKYNSDITKIIIADQTNRQMKANIKYYLDNYGKRKASINMVPMLYSPTGAPQAMLGVSPTLVGPNMIAPGVVSPMIGQPVKPYGFVKNTNTGQQVVRMDQARQVISPVQPSIGGINMMGSMGYMGPMAGMKQTVSIED